MYNRLFFLLIGSLLSVTLLVAKEPKSGTVRNFQGTWQIVALEANGENKPAEEFQGWKVVVTKDEMWVVKPEGPDPKLKYKLDTGTNPHSIDLTVQEGKDKGKVVPGIFAIDKDQLRLCLNIFGDASNRPTDFKTKQGDGVAYATLKRAKGK